MNEMHLALHGVAIITGIGFTMSIFITNLAFADQPDVINASKMAVFAASLLAGVLGFLWLRFAGTGEPTPEAQTVTAQG